MTTNIRLRSGLTLIVAAAVVLGVAACGGEAGDDAGPGGGGTGETLSAAQATGNTDPDKIADDVGDGFQRAPADGQSAGATTQGSGGSVPLASQLDRKIIRVATVSIATDEVSRRFEDVGNIAAGAGGIVASSSFGHSGDHQTASVTIKVPADRYQDVLRELRGLGEVRDESSNANDVTEEYTDLNSQLRNLQATERQYLEFLARAANIGEVLQVQDRLSAVRAEIEQVQGRINLLGNSTELATITVHLNPPAVAKDQPADEGRTSPREVAEDAFAASIDVLNGALIVVVAVAAFAWWVVPVTIVGLIVLRRFGPPRGGAAPAATPPTTPVA